MSIAGATDQPPLDSPATVKPTDRSLADRIVWIDCEMTGLSLDADALIEVAALVTDYELNQLGDGVDIVIRPPAAALAQMDPFIRDMHTTSGLLAELDGELADQKGVQPYLRAPAVGIEPLFIDALADATLGALSRSGVAPHGQGCKADWKACPHRNRRQAA